MKRRYLFLFILQIICVEMFSQSIETGFVKEYNGEKAKTPLAGVELSVNGAPTTVSDGQGHYELKFAVLKPGEAVKYNEIYKSGYVIFNKDALGYWRISNNRKPFVIVMCKEGEFRELKKKFYGIIEKSYRDEYLKQKAQAEQLATDKANLETRLKVIEREYEEKISNINTYVEIFARIDRAEMDSIRAKAIEQIENGNIEEAINTYNQINLTQKAEEQIRKMDAGQEVMKTAQTMLVESHQDLLSTIKIAQEKIGVYIMGGDAYNGERNNLIKQLIGWYEKLNVVFGGQYNEDLGQWICSYADYAKFWENRLESYQQAASLPSWHGYYHQARHLFLRSYESNQYVSAAKYCLQETLKMDIPDSIRVEVQEWLEEMPDFYSVIPSGDTIYFKRNKDLNSVTICKKTPSLSNKVSGTVIIPNTITHDGVAYRIMAIGDKAFCRNLNINKMVLPSNLYSIDETAFEGCSIDTLVLNGEPLSISANTIPKETYLLVPKKLTKKEWYVTHMLQLDSLNRVQAAKEPVKPFQQIIDSSQTATTDAEMSNVRRDLLRLYVQISLSVSKEEQLRLPQGLTFLDYEEMLSIGIIAINAMIKGKSVEQLRKYNEEYMSTAVKWAIRNEMHHRYDWYGYLSRMETNEKKEDWDLMIAENVDADTLTRRIVGRIHLYRSLRVLLDKSAKARTEYYSVIWNNVLSSIEKQPKDKQTFLMEMVTGDHNIEPILQFISDALVKYSVDKEEMYRILVELHNTINQLSSENKGL